MSSTAEDLVRRHRYTVEDYYRMGEVGIYARFAIPEVWLVDITGGRITCHREPSHTGFLASEVLDLAAPVSIPGLPSLRLDLSALL